jgi:Tol biopolymer transport system component
MFNKRITASVCICFIWIGLLGGCATHPSITGTLLAQTPGMATKVATITVESPTPTQVIATSNPTISSTPYPLEGELFFQVGLHQVYAIKFPSGMTSKILEEDDWIITNPISVPTGFLYFLEGSMTDPSQLYRVKLDGSEMKKIFSDANDDRQLAVSSDGNRIALIQAPASGGENNFSAIDLRRGGLPNTVFSSTKTIISFSWSTSGQKLAFSLWNPDLVIDYKPIYGDLHIMNANGSGRTQIKSDFQIVTDPPSWSPDDSQIVVPVHDDIGINLYIIDVKSHAMKKLTNSNVVDARDPVWSPNGDRILFIQGSNYCTIAPDGSGQKVLASAPDPKSAYKVAVWSPDGRYVALERNLAVYIVNADGGTPLSVFSADQISNLSWIKTTQP